MFALIGHEEGLIRRQSNVVIDLSNHPDTATVLQPNVLMHRLTAEMHRDTESHQQQVPKQSKMKVTVIFDNMSVVVPCGDGELTVAELISRAVNRFKKASQKPVDAVVNVRCLKTVVDNGILDIDDMVTDVCDDKDRLIAVYDEGVRKDIDNNNSSPLKHEDYSSPYNPSTLSDNDSGVAADSYIVSSNPASTHASLNSSSRPPRGIQRKFMANKNSSFRSSVSSNSPHSSPEMSRHGLKAPAFTRDSNRKSLSSNHPMLYSWIDQQDQYNSRTYYTDGRASPANSEKSISDEEISLDQRLISNIEIKPYTTADGKEVGLVVNSVVEDSYMDRVGELQMADLITEINGISLKNMSNAQAFDIYQHAIKSELVRLKRTRSHTFFKDQIMLPPTRSIELPKAPAPKELLETKEAPKIITSPVKTDETHESAIEAPDSNEAINIQPTTSKHTFYVNLYKGNDGLGFTVTSKDVLTSRTVDFFVKSILNKGAAIADGRIKAGDQLLTINRIPLHDKSQTEVVKILRSAHGMVVLQLARNKSEEEDSTQTTSQDTTNMTSPEETLSNSSTSPLTPDERLKLTISLSNQNSAGLGISVKGRTNDIGSEDEGIFVKSVIKGGAAAKDGRLKVNDQLLVINDTSLIGLSNNDAMNILRTSMEQSVKNGSIQVIVGRSSKVMASPVKTATTPSKRESPKILNRRSLIGLDSDQRFNEIYLQKTPSHSINRNKSYFKAVVPNIPSDVEKETSETPTQRSKPRPVSVSSNDLPEIQQSRPIYVANLPDKSDSPNFTRRVAPPTYEEAIQRKNSNASTQSGKTSSSRGSKNDDNDSKFKILPDKMQRIPSDEKKKIERNFSVVSNPIRDVNRQLSHSHNDLSNLEEMSRCASVASQSSLDSIYVGPNKIPFSRDAFGRSSMSERKGRAHIDATKSNFYMKLKKYKSMEELRASSMDKDDTPTEGMSQRSESVDTIISKMDEEDQVFGPTFSRGTVYSASTPWYTHASDDIKAAAKRGSPSQPTDKKDVQTMSHSNNMLKKFLFKPKPVRTVQQPVKLRSPMQLRKKGDTKPRPYSCIVDSNRASLLNNSFKMALDTKTKSEIRDSLLKGDDKKKKAGFLKGISTLLKRKKNVREDQPNRSHSPEYLDEDLKFPMRNKLNGRPLSMSAELYSNRNPDELSSRFFKPDKLQRELVEKKKKELERKDVKKRKSDVGLNYDVSQDVILTNQSPLQLTPSNKNTGSHENILSNQSSSRQTWNMHEAESVREKSKKFFDSMPRDSGRGMRSNTTTSQEVTTTRENTRSNNEPPDVLRNSKRLELRRQSSLPPRNKKDSTEIHRVLPKTPDGDLSPELNIRKSGRGTNSAPNSKPATPIRKTGKSPFDSLPRRHKKDKAEQNDVTANFTSLSDLRRNESVSISMQAQI